MVCFGIVEDVDDKGSEGVGEVLEREEGLLAVVGGVEGDLVSLFECSVRRRRKGVLGRVMKQDVEVGEASWLRQKEEGVCPKIASAVEEEADALGDDGGGTFSEMFLLRGCEVYRGDASGADLLLKIAEDGFA